VTSASLYAVIVLDVFQMDDSESQSPGEERKKPAEPELPLADTVISKIFQDADVSGLALRSLLNAVLADSGDKLVGDVLWVPPRKG
jgi:hypothetical protein